MRSKTNGRQNLALALACSSWVLHIYRAGAQDENTIGYRHEFYREDNNRIEVATETVLFDVGLLPKMRLNGNVVVDAISGATPSGAPPQSQWPFPGFRNLYNQVYQPAYNVQFNQYIAQNEIYVNAGYETAQQLTNAAIQFAKAAAGTIASNSAASSLAALTGNPNYRNNSVPLVYMHDHRTAFGLGLPIEWQANEFNPSIAYSEESDYISWAGAMNYSRYFNNKNTALSLGWAHDVDSVRDDKFIWEPKLTDNMFVGLVQLITPDSYLTLNGSVALERGYLADPYRGVMAASGLFQLNPDDAALIPEKRPRHRASDVLFASWTQYIPPASASVEASYRFFHDTFGVNAHTLDLAWHQKIGKNLVISPEFRAYWQGASDFYYILIPDYNNRPNYYSSDYRLSNLVSLAGGITLTWRLQEHVSLDVSCMRYVMEGLDGVTSQSVYPNADVLSTGLRIWF